MTTVEDLHARASELEADNARLGEEKVGPLLREANTAAHQARERGDPRIFDGVRDDMDDTTVGNVAALERAAQRLLMEHTVTLDYVAKLVTQ